jgi:hypothetical protein
MQVAAINASEGARPAFDASKHPSGIIPQLQNMVATVNLGCKLDLKQIALHARNSEYNPKASLPTQLLPLGHGKWLLCLVSRSRENNNLAVCTEIRSSDHENQGAKDNCLGVCIWEDGKPSTVAFVMVTGTVI